MQILQILEQNLNCLIGAGLNMCLTVWLIVSLTSKYIMLVPKFGV